LAETIGLVVMRLADAELLPYDFTNFADTIRKYVDQLEKLWKTKSEEIKERNTEIEEGVYVAIADPKQPIIPPKVESVPPFLNFAPLRNGLEKLQRSSEHYDKAVQQAARGKKPL